MKDGQKEDCQVLTFYAFREDSDVLSTFSYRVKDTMKASALQTTVESGVET